MKILYTTQEGGMFHELEIKSRRQHIIRELKKNRVPIKVNYGLRTITRGTGSKLKGIKVFSVLFRDGRIWCSYFGEYRPHGKMDNKIFKMLYNRIINNNKESK